MSRHLYRICRARMRGEVRVDHHLEEASFEPDDGTSYGNDVLSELDKLKKSGNYEEEEEF